MNQNDFLYNINFKFSLYLHDFLYFQNRSKTVSKQIKEKSYKRFYLELFTVVGTSQRYPSVNELYGDGSLLLPSINLKKEKSLFYEIGLKSQVFFSFFQLITNVNYFNRQVEDLILFISNSQKTMISINADKANIQGAEFSFTAKISKYFRSRFQYTLMNAINQSSLPYYNNKYLPYQPKHKFNINLNVGVTQYRLLFDFDYIGANYRDRYNSYYFYLDKRYYLSSSFIVYFINKKYQLSFIIKNILDEKSYDVIGFPLPSRIYEIRFKGRL